MRFIFCCALLCGIASPAIAQPTTKPGSTNSQVRILIVTGIDYPGHLWRQTAPVLADALRKDGRLTVFTVEDPWFLDSDAIHQYDVIVLHFQNWEQPAPGERCRQNLQKFVADGKGMVLLHYACGAWHGEWPEFAHLAGRVWAGPNVRQHDPFGAFRVELTKIDHPITRGLADFETRDELYTCLTGDHPVTVLAEAKSKIDGKYYPMAFASAYGKGRTFHCTLGHDVQAFNPPPLQALLQRACVWAAGLEVVDKPASISTGQPK